MSPDELGFIAAICSKPDDDAPRLTYADWLEEHGQDERAELIRVQCEVDGPYTAWSSQTDHWKHEDTLRSRINDLLTMNCRKWFPECLRLVGSGSMIPMRNQDQMSGICQRGFVGEVSCTATDWLAHHRALCWHPDHCDWPCPPTAQPIQVVRLTTQPMWGTWTQNQYGYFNDYYREDCQRRWPWLTVELPPIIPGVRFPEGSEVRTYPGGAVRVTF